MEEGWTIISCYTRKQALEDGVLVDITTPAFNRGFCLPAAITQTLISRFIEPNETLKKRGQNFDDRLNDLLVLTYASALKNRNLSRIYFNGMFLNESGGYDRPKIIADISPGDDGKPVLTIMLPEDD